MCEVCVRYKMIYEETAKFSINLVFTSRCVRAQKVRFENDWTFPDSVWTNTLGML